MPPWDMMREESGFTLIELVMVIVIVAILALVVNAKAGFFSGWQEAGSGEVLSSYINAAQKLAIANHRTVYVNISSTQLVACYDLACSLPCSNFDGTSMVLTVPSGAMASTSPGFTFDAVGRPSFVGVYAVSYGGRTINIEPETGLIW